MEKLHVQPEVDVTPDCGSRQSQEEEGGLGKEEIEEEDYDTDLDIESELPIKPQELRSHFEKKKETTETQRKIVVNVVEGVAADGQTGTAEEGDGGVDGACRGGFGELAYMTACEMLAITPAQKVISGLSTSAINLKYRNLGPIGAKAVAAALVHNERVETLDLEDNGLEGEGGVYIADMLKENSFITNVNLAKNNLGSIGALAIADLLQADNYITRLNLADNQFRDCDAEALALAIEKNERVIHLNLSHNFFSEEGAVALGRAIGANNFVEVLDISWNQIRKKGAVMICAGLKRNYCLTSANLSWNGFGHGGCVALCEMLRGNRYLRELDISHNNINWEGAILVSKGLKENDTIEILFLGGNPLTMTGVLDILEAVDNPSSVTTYIGFDNIPVNRKIIYMMESLQKNRTFSMTYGSLLESEDVLGRRLVLRCDPLKLLIQFLTDKGIRPVDLFRTYDKDKQYRVTREQFIQGLKTAKAPLDDYELERVIARLDSSGKEGKISYQRLMKGVKEQIKMNRAEEKQKLLAEKSEAEDHRKILKTGLEHVATAARVSFVTSARSTPSPTNERPNSASSIGTSTVKSTLGGKSSLGRSAGNGTESKGSFVSQSSSKVNGIGGKAKDGHVTRGSQRISVASSNALIKSPVQMAKGGRTEA